MVKKGLYWTLGNGEKVNFLHDIWREESPVIGKIPQEWRSRIIENSKVNHFVDNNKIWNIGN